MAAIMPVPSPTQPAGRQPWLVFLCLVSLWKPFHNQAIIIQNFCTFYELIIHSGAGWIAVWRPLLPFSVLPRFFSFIPGQWSPTLGNFHKPSFTNSLMKCFFCKEFHFPEFTSAVADMKNSVADRNNGQPR